MAVCLTGVSADEKSRERFIDAYRATGKRLDKDESCVRPRPLGDVPPQTGWRRDRGIRRKRVRQPPGTGTSPMISGTGRAR